MNLAAAASSDAVGIQPNEGGSQPTPLLQLFDLGPSTFGDWLTVRPTTLTTARRWFGQHHYTGTVGTESATFYGVFAGDLLAVVAVGHPSNDHGVAARFGLEGWRGNMEITRVAVHPDAPRCSASRAIARVLRTLTEPGDIDWLFSYADTGQGHHGGIYQALGAVYVGLSLPAPRTFVINGEQVHPRSVVARYGTMGESKLRAMGIRFERPEPSTRKHTYVLPIGPRAAEVRAHLERFRRPYPKRTP